MMPKSNLDKRYLGGEIDDLEGDLIEYDFPLKSFDETVPKIGKILHNYGINFSWESGEEKLFLFIEKSKFELVEILLQIFN